MPLISLTSVVILSRTSRKLDFSPAAQPPLMTRRACLLGYIRRKDHFSSHHHQGIFAQLWPRFCLVQAEAGCCGFFRTSHWSISPFVDGSLLPCISLAPCAAFRPLVEFAFLVSLVTVYSCLTMIFLLFLISSPCITSIPSSLSSSKPADRGLTAPRTDVRTLSSLELKADEFVWPLRPA